MRISRHLLAVLTLSTAVGTVAPAQAAFEFLKKEPAKAVAKPTAQSGSSASSSSTSTPAIVPVTRLDAVDGMSNAELAKDVPVWSAKPVADTSVIPLTPVITASDSLEVIDGPLLPGPTDGAAVVGLPRETLATTSAQPKRTVTFEQDPTTGIHRSILWENNKPVAQTNSMVSIPASPTVTRQSTLVTETTTPSVAPVMPATPVLQKPLSAPAPIVETVIETKQAELAPPADDAVVQGFGSSIPMAMALRQIVPPTYRFSFDPGIDPGQRVSWRGGKKWSQVVEDVAASQGLKSEIAGNVIAFRRTGNVLSPRLEAAPRPLDNPFSTTPPAATLAARPMTSSIMMEDIVLGNTMPGSTAPTPSPSTMTLAEAENTAAPITLFGKPPEPVVEKTVTETTTVKTPVVERTIAVAEDTTSTAAPAPAMPSTAAPITDETEVTASPVVTDDPMSLTASATVVPAPHKEKPPVVIDNKIAESQEWVARSGSSLRSVLQDWSKQAHVSLVWSSDFDYPLQTDIRIQSNYPDAVRTLLAGFSKAQPKPIGRLHKNAGVGAQPVLIVDTPRLING